VVETSINWLLQQNSDINTLLQNRVSPYIRDNDASYPAVTYQKTGFDQEEYLDGTFSSISEHNIDLDVWDITYINVKELSEKIKAFLTSFSGNANGNQIDLIKFNHVSEDVQTDPERYLITLKFTFFTNEA
jgi:hypothetical protein